MLAWLQYLRIQSFFHLTQCTFQAFKYFKQLKTTTKSCWLTEMFLSQYTLLLGPSLCAAWSTMCFFLILRIQKPFWKAQNRHLSRADTYAVAWHVFKHSIIKKIYWTRFIIFDGSLSHYLGTEYNLEEACAAWRQRTTLVLVHLQQQTQAVAFQKV